MRRPSVTTVVGAVVLLLLYLPIGVVVANAFNADETLSGWGGFTLDWFGQAFRDDRIVRDFRRQTRRIAFTGVNIPLSRPRIPRADPPAPRAGSAPPGVRRASRPP